MMLKVLTVLAATAGFVTPLTADDAAKPGAAAEAPKENPELEAEFAYAEALVNNAYSDIAAPLIEATKKRWPESEARFFAVEIRSLITMGKYEEAEKKIAALPDRKSTKYWAARLEMANNLFAGGDKPACMKIYDDFFKVFPKAPPDIRRFYTDASYAYGQLLVGDRQYAKAVGRYEHLLTQVPEGEPNWCHLACETVDIYLRLATAITDPKQNAQLEKYLAAATKIVDRLLWQTDQYIYFGRAVSMKAHIEQLRGHTDKASDLIDEYKTQLTEIHDQLVDNDPDGRLGLLKQSPLPECLYLQAKMLWDAAKAEYAKPKHDDEKVKVFMFGPKVAGKRQFGKGAFAMAQNVFLNYETSSWAPAAGDLSEEIRVFTKQSYGKDVKTNVTKAQIDKVRAAQFREANEKFATKKYLEAIDAYYKVLAQMPEREESIGAIENIVCSYLDLMIDTKDAKLKEEYRINADAVEGYLVERFCEWKDKLIMTRAGDACTRLAAKETEYRFAKSAERLYLGFLSCYRDHGGASNLAMAKAGELQKAERYADALKYWNIIAENYSNSVAYATSLVQASTCYGKLGDRQNEIESLKKYLTAETVNIRKLQAEFRLAQMYQKDGVAMLEASETNEVAEAKTEAEKAGMAQIIRAIKTFTGFTKAVDAALADPQTRKDDEAKYNELREASMFMVGECWSRMKRPEEKLDSFRERAARSYSDYIAAFPKGKYAKTGYVKLGTIYTALKQMEKSKDALDRLAREFPDSDEAKNAKPRLAKSLIEMGMKREGAEIYSEMLRTDGAYTAGQFVSAGDALVESKNFDLAHQAYEKAIKLAGTNSLAAVGRARLGMARSFAEQKSYAEAREALDQLLNDKELSKLSLAADAYFEKVRVASAQGREEKDNDMRKKYFGAAIGSLKKVRQYWKSKPGWEQDTLDLMSGEVLIDRMHAEEQMGLKEEALETCGRAASTFQVFLQAHGVDEAHPFESLEPGAVANLERCYADMVPLFKKLGPEHAKDVVKFGSQYLEYFPDGKAATEISNCINEAKVDLPAEGK